MRKTDEKYNKIKYYKDVCDYLHARQEEGYEAYRAYILSLCGTTPQLPDTGIRPNDFMKFTTRQDTHLIYSRQFADLLFEQAKYPHVLKNLPGAPTQATPPSGAGGSAHRYPPAFHAPADSAKRAQEAGVRLPASRRLGSRPWQNYTTLHYFKPGRFSLLRGVLNRLKLVLHSDLFSRRRTHAPVRSPAAVTRWRLWKGPSTGSRPGRYFLSEAVS